jgi:hypothetical protein
MPVFVPQIPGSNPIGSKHQPFLLLDLFSPDLAFLLGSSPVQPE